MCLSMACFFAGLGIRHLPLLHYALYTSLSRGTIFPRDHCYRAASRINSGTAFSQGGFLLRIHRSWTDGKGCFFEGSRIFQRVGIFPVIIVLPPTSLISAFSPFRLFSIVTPSPQGGGFPYTFPVSLEGAALRPKVLVFC